MSSAQNSNTSAKEAQSLSPTPTLSPKLSHFVMPVPRPGLAKVKCSRTMSIMAP